MRHGTPAMSRSEPAGDTASNGFIISRCAAHTFVAIGRHHRRSAGAEHLGDRRRGRASFLAHSLVLFGPQRHAATLSRSGVRFSRRAPRDSGDQHAGATDEVAVDARVGEPGVGWRARAHGSAWCGASSSTSAPPAGSSQPGASAINDLERLEAGGPAHQRAAWLPLDDVARAGRALRARRRTAGSTRSRRSAAAQLGRAARRTTIPRAARTRVAAEPMPATLARATASASSLTSVAHTSASGSSRASASAIAPEPVPRSATAYDVSAASHGVVLAAARAEPRGLVDRDLRHHLGLGPRHQHPPVDQQVEAEERPRPSTYCSGSPRDAPFEHVVEVLPPPRRRRLVARRSTSSAPS